MTDYDKELDGILEEARASFNLARGPEDNRATVKSAKAKLSALLRRVEVEAKLDELRRMQVRTMDDPDDDTNLFWYRTYTMPEFEKRYKELEAEL